MDVRERTACLLFLCCVALIGARAQALELNGVASFTELGEETYLAGLYIDWRSTDPADFFADYRERKMEVRFASQVSRRRWVNNWMQSIAINNSRQHLENAAEELSAVLSTFEGNLFRGDHVEIHYLPESGTELRLNGHVLASGHSAAVFNLFLSSWLGPVPPSSQFRALLLGLESSTDSTRFVTLQPAIERIDAVGAWTAVEGARDDDELAQADAVSPEIDAAASDPDVGTLETEAVAVTHSAAGADEAPLPQTAAIIVPPSDSFLSAPELPRPVLAAVSPDETREEAALEAAPAPGPTSAVAAVAQESVPPADAASRAVDEAPAGVFEEEELFEDDEGELDLSVAAILGQRDYLSQLIREVYSNIRYPDRAVRRNYEGDVRMRLIIERDGALANMQMLQGARHDMLNEEAERAVLAATPFAPIPAELRGERIEVELPIHFRLE